ncbi:MAG: enoyl-CoA hydratase/isomerase family protein [Pseudomonadales bacterium]|nr:enoyl-CoA hydratase/isomerase family protein [Pseudomonadales bacterium]
MTDKIIIEQPNPPSGSGSGIGVITLNDPRTINALSLEMIRSLYSCLTAWQTDPQVAAVFIDSTSERGLCSGGNIRHIYDSMTAQDAHRPNPLALEFFSEEYKLDQLIHHYPKPIIVWGHGIVMGGGVGLMVGASHRVVTPDSTLAMPEINIGLFPDVGASWFLNRMPAGCGLFLGLTGASIQGMDALYAGLADYLLTGDTKANLLCQLKNNPWLPDSNTNNQSVTALLAELDISAEGKVGPLEMHQSVIQNLMDNYDGIIPLSIALFDARISAENTDTDRWWNSAIDNLKVGCPTTAHLVFEQLRRGRDRTLAEVFAMEIKMVMQCVAHPDFREGVRALLVDKDRAPKWQHQGIANVPSQWVDEHFESIE